MWFEYRLLGACFLCFGLGTLFRCLWGFSLCLVFDLGGMLFMCFDGKQCWRLLVCFCVVVVCVYLILSINLGKTEMNPGPWDEF